jgi:hypothetical protein
MFIPPYSTVLAALGTDPETLKRRGTVEVPREFIDMLLRCLLYLGEFDEQTYLSANPDIKDAVRSRQVKDAQAHYVGYGYFEGRNGAKAGVVDERWYLKTYPDVAAAIKRGEIRSAAEHYRVAGAREWRLPNHEAESEVRMWKQALGVAPETPARLGEAALSQSFSK